MSHVLSRPALAAFALPVLLALSACADREERAVTADTRPLGDRVSGNVGVTATPNGVYPHLGVGMSVCRNPTPFRLSLGGLLGPIGASISC